MTVEALIFILPALTFAMVLGWVWLSKRRTESKLDDPKSEPSSLAKDG
ncbi:MAG: hypothetical protein AAFQ58_08915 [Pseudomonadota bacterium]